MEILLYQHCNWQFWKFLNPSHGSIKPYYSGITPSHVRGMSMFVASSPKNMEEVGPLPTLVAYTCGGGELLRDIHTYTMFA